MRLKLGEWASVAEIAGAIAVIVSLIYVGYQVNDNTAAIRSAAANDASVAMQTWYLEMGSNPEASRLTIPIVGDSVSTCTIIWVSNSCLLPDLPASSSRE